MIKTAFSLLNGAGDSFPLNNVETGYLFDVEGLGFQYDAKYQRIGSKWIRTNYEPVQMQITGDIVFTGSTEFDAGQAFMAFLNGSSKFTLECTMETVTRLKDVDIISWDPEAIGIETLAYHMVLVGTSQWYEPENETFVLDVEAADEKEYDYEYNNEYTYNDYSAARATVNNQSTFGAPFVVRFNGPISNPSILVYQNGVLIAEADITGGVNSGDYIEWSSVDGDLHCFKSVSGVQTNLVGDFDISKTNFFKLPTGTSTIEITATSSITQPITITVFRYYNNI